MNTDEHRWASRVLAAGVLTIVATLALAHTADEKGAIDYGKAKPTAFGKASDPRKAKRTVRIEMSDAMRFDPAELTVKRGETVRFVAANKGQVMHEMVLGTMQDLKAHSEHMKMNPAMEHHEPYMLHVPPGKTGEMGWQFTRAGEFYYGCLVPGHFEAGMIGKVKVVATPTPEGGVP
jgi:uncharacterized cupredoxin-like copper-binding protein